MLNSGFKGLLRFLLALLYVIGLLLRPLQILYGYVFTPKRKLPVFRDPLLEMPAVDLAAKIRNREVLSVSVIQAYVERIKQVNPLINAIVENRFEAAIQDARAADAEVEAAHHSGTLDELAVQKPLLGVPLTVKESCCVKGMPVTQGSKSFKAMKASYTGKAADLVIRAGAIPLLVSNTPEFCYSWETYNLVTGRTLNPYDQRRTPGGSSGGEGALLGAGASLISVGSDLAGSIRVPSLNNGVYGHKPTVGYVPLEGHMPHVEDPKILQMLVVGPMTRYAKDLPLLFDVMTEGKAPRSEIPLKDIRVFYKYKMGNGPITGIMDQSMMRAQEDVVRHFISQMNKVEELDLDFGDSMELSVVHYIDLDIIPDVLYNPDNPKRRRIWLFELIKCFFGVANVTLAALFFQLLVSMRTLIPKSVVRHYKDKALMLRESIIDRLGTDGVLLYPTNALPATRHYHYFTNMMMVMYTALFNVLNLPSTHVQVGYNTNQLPLGFQVVAAPGQDHLCFQVAAAIEKYFGGWRPPSSI